MEADQATGLQIQVCLRPGTQHRCRSTGGVHSGGVAGGRVETVRSQLQALGRSPISTGPSDHTTINVRVPGAFWELTLC